MLTKGRKNKRGDRGSLEDGDLNNAKRPNMAASRDKETVEGTENPPPEPSLAEIKEMLAEIQTSVVSILKENQIFKEELVQLKSAFQAQQRDLNKMKASLEATTKENRALREELSSTKKKLNNESEETERLSEELDNLEQYTRKNSLEIHGIPEDAYTSTEDVVIKLGETLNVPIEPQDIEISHKLNTRNKPIIVKFVSHKVKSKLYKSRIMLKRVNASDVFPSRSYAAAVDRKPRIFINENLTAYRGSIIKEVNNMRKDELIQSVWTLDGKVYVKTSPDGSPVIGSIAWKI